MKAQVYRKYLEFGVLCLLAFGLLWWFGRQLDWGQVRQAVKHSNPYLLAAAIAIVCVSYLFRACRWGALLRPLGPSRLADLFAATTIGFSSVFLIGRTGEVVRPVVLPMRDPRVSPSAAFVTIMIERIYDMMAVVLLFALNLIWFSPPPALQDNLSRVRIVGIGLLLAAIFGVGWLIWFRKKSGTIIRILGNYLTRWRLIPKRLTKLILRTLEQLAQALRVLTNVRELSETIGWTALLWFGIAVANLLVLRAFGLPFGFSQALFVLGWSLAGSLVPTPGGAAGAFHWATAAGLVILGVHRETAAAVSIVIHVVDFGPAVLFGFFYVLRGDLSFSRLRALVSPEAVEHVVEDEDLVPGDRPEIKPMENAVGH